MPMQYLVPLRRKLMPLHECVHRQAPTLLSSIRIFDMIPHTCDKGKVTHVDCMLNKNSLAVKKVRGQSEATMVISDQKL